MTAVSSDEPVVGTSGVRRLEKRERELERRLGGKTMEAEILHEALASGAVQFWRHEESAIAIGV